MHHQKYKNVSREKLLRELLRDLEAAKGAGINGLRVVIRKYLPAVLRRAIVEKSPEFFVLYYLGFRLPPHQVKWIKLYLAVKYLLELAPRDHGKSWIFSYGLPLYDIYASYSRTGLESVDYRILQISKTDGQAFKFATQVKGTIEKNKFLLEDFGDIRDMSNWLKGHFLCRRRDSESVEKDYTYEKTGALGAVTGGHFHRVNADDILDDENTKTNDRMEGLENWWWGTIWNLREVYTKFAVVGTRKKRNDLYNTLMQSPLWVVNGEKAIIKYPMIQEKGSDKMVQGWLYITNKGRHVFHQNELKANEKVVDIELLTDDYEVLWPPTEATDNDGNVLMHPDSGEPLMFGWGIKQLLLDRAGQGGTYFDREKQNQISSEEGAIFKREWLTFFDNQQLVMNTTDGYYYLEGQLAG